MSIKVFRHCAAMAAILCSAVAEAQVVATPLPAGCTIAGSVGWAPRAHAEAIFPPPQLQIRTPVEPSAFASHGRNYLIYELHLQNFSSEPLTVGAIEVSDADDTASRPLAMLQAASLDAVLRPVGADQTDGPGKLAAGQTAIAFLCLALDRNDRVPNKLAHRVDLGSGFADGPVIGTGTTRLHVLGRPVTGGDWTASNGPDIHSHHRTGLFVAGGLAQISRRYAIDWRIEKDGAQFAGDPREVRSYYAYGEQVLAVADGIVITARDGLPDNIPRTAAGFNTALPISMDNAGGNSIVIDLGDGQFALYAHLKPGSVRVKAGERVRRGDVVAQIGNSGDARWPHLHFQVTSNPHILASEGLPYLLDQYRVQVADKAWETRTREFPFGATRIDFGPAPTKTLK
jgi:hypothetical protein